MNIYLAVDGQASCGELSRGLERIASNLVLTSKERKIERLTINWICILLLYNLFVQAVQVV